MASKADKRRERRKARREERFKRREERKDKRLERQLKRRQQRIDFKLSKQTNRLGARENRISLRQSGRTDRVNIRNNRMIENVRTRNEEKTKRHEAAYEAGMDPNSGMIAGFGMGSQIAKSGAEVFSNIYGKGGFSNLLDDNLELPTDTGGSKPQTGLIVGLVIGAVALVGGVLALFTGKKKKK